MERSRKVADALRKEQAMDGVRGRFRRWLSGNLKLVTVSAVSALAASAAVAIATVPDSGGVIHSCYKVLPATGAPALGPNLRVIDPSIAGAGQSCDPTEERSLDFNQLGLVGPTGPAGVTPVIGPSGMEGPNPDCSSKPVGHFKLSASLEGDVCGIKQVKIGARSSAVGGQNGPSNQFELTRLQDAVSTKLLKATAQGTQFSSAKIQVYKPGTANVVKTFSLSNAAISSYAAGQGQERPTESLTIISVPKKGV
jgi:hypothetical protein